ncbi:hypothetical protein U1Q18_026176 [Sarracenia purpurea var. burkii]
MSIDASHQQKRKEKATIIAHNLRINHSVGWKRPEVRLPWASTQVADQRRISSVSNNLEQTTIEYDQSTRFDRGPINVQQLSCIIRSASPQPSSARPLQINTNPRPSSGTIHSTLRLGEFNTLSRDSTPSPTSRACNRVSALKLTFDRLVNTSQSLRRGRWRSLNQIRRHPESEAVEVLKGEMRRIRDDLSCRIRDQAFVLEMSRIAEEEWKKTGDRFNRPYGEDLSSFMEIPDPEFF